MNTSKHLISLSNFLIEGNLDQAKRMLARDDIRIKKHFLILLEAALQNPDLEPAKLIWDEFEKVSTSNHLPLKLQAVQMIVQKAHGKMCRIIYPQFHHNISHTDEHNLGCAGLEQMDGDILSVCWDSIDFKKGVYNWRAFFEHPLCYQTVLNLLKEIKKDRLNASFLVLADRFHCGDLVDDIFRLNYSREVFRIVVIEGSSDAINQILDNLDLDQENNAVAYVRYNKVRHSALERLESVVIQRQAQRIANELPHTETVLTKRKM
jgi:hypothetical protein